MVRFRVSGTELDNNTAAQLLEGVLPSHADHAQVFKVQTHRAAGLAPLAEAEPGKDVVVVKVSTGPALVLHPENAKVLLSQPAGALRGTETDAVNVSASLPWTEKSAAERGGIASAATAVLEWFGVVRLKDVAANQTAKAIAQQVDSQVKEGLYQLGPEAIPQTLTQAVRVTDDTFKDYQAGEPLLVLIHGTFVNTESTFGKLWAEHKDIVSTLFTAYKNRVFAFDHPTLATSPVANALALARALPPDASVRLLTHSRGGLIAEILVRASSASSGDDDLKRYFGDGGPTEDLGQLLELRSLLRSRHISFDRVVRVACPARGTLLASSRLDAYLSVIQWLMHAAGLQVTPIFVSFLAAVARQRTEPKVLGGLSAMMPDSGLVRWLNSPLDQGAGKLYVIAGDSGGDSLKTWLKTLVADAFFWTDNDLVVQTRSMYGGVPRGVEAAARFTLLEGAEVSHFSYFSFPRSAKAICDALLPTPKNAWQTIGPLSWRGTDSGGVRGARPNTSAKSCVYVIPDFFGSHLEDRDGNKLWLSARSMAEFDRLAVNGNALTATELVAPAYGTLCDRLQEAHEVVPFPYDWRLPIEVEAKRLADSISARMKERRSPLQPIKILAHGMGGLLLRAMQVKDRATWDAMMAMDGARIVMLGTPNSGTWTPLQVLTGDDTLGNVLNSTGPLFADETIRRTLAGMAGFIQLQAGLVEPLLQLDSTAGWEELESIQQRSFDKAGSWHARREPWAIPTQALLDQAAAFWRTLDRHLPELGPDMGKIAFVIGAAHSTPSELIKKDDALCFNSVERGDGRVTLDSTRIFNARVWCIDAPHGQLPSAVAGFSGLVDLLDKGTTTRLGRYDPDSRGARKPAATEPASAQATRSRPFGRPSRTVPPADIAELFNAIPDGGAEPVGERLVVKVYHGDLRFIRAPLLVGHYKSLVLTGSEAVLDILVNGRMNKAVRAGIYPERVGSYQIFENGRQINFGRQKQRLIPRPKAAIIVGLGEEGKLNAQHLGYTLRNGIMAYAERLAEIDPGVPAFELAATLVGSGGTGIAVGNSALALVQAITDANIKLKEVGWPLVRALEIVEMYLDRATDAWRVLKLHAASSDRLVVDGFLVEGNGRLRRPLDSSYRGAKYDFISARATTSLEESQPVIAYSLDTKRARTEVRAQRAQGTLLRDLVATASNSSLGDPQTRRTLFNLLVPVEIEPYLTGSSDLVMELDHQTSALPWELLDTEFAAKPSATRAQALPWAIRCKLIRKLQVERYRAQIVDASVEDNVLIIGEPLVDAPYQRLPGAQREAESIYTVARPMIGTANDRVILLASQNDARTIINTLFARNYRLVHIAGHGTGGSAGGVVLSGSHTFLGPNEIEAMRVTPELVFVNCCYLAEREKDKPYDRVAFAASVADALINIGVRCVIAAGWAVEDEAAEKFATTFYTELFDGARFIDAVGQARRAAWEANRAGNTWAAYQCYGDPDWSWRPATTANELPPQEEYEGVASATTLILVLQSIATESLYSSAENVRLQRARLEHLETRFAEWSKRGDVAQEFGYAYAALPDRKKAMDWLDVARKASDGSATLSALEVYAEQQSLLDAETSGQAVDKLRESIDILSALRKHVGPTLRRCSLLGYALRRLSVARDKSQPLHVAKTCFEQAAKMKDEKYNFYPARAALECDLRECLSLGKPLQANWRETEIAEVARLVEQAAYDNPDFWSIVAQTQLDLLKSLIVCRLQPVLHDILASLNDLHNRIRTPRYWIYIYDDARFLLEPYIQSTAGKDPAEQNAAQTLLKTLKDYSYG